MDGESYIVDDPMKKLKKMTVQQEPMLKFEAASEGTMYEVVMINYDSEDDDPWLLWHVKGISGKSFTKGKIMGDDMMIGKEYEGSIFSCSIQFCFYKDNFHYYDFRHLEGHHERNLSFCYFVVQI